MIKSPLPRPCTCPPPPTCSRPGCSRPAVPRPAWLDWGQLCQEHLDQLNGKPAPAPARPLHCRPGSWPECHGGKRR
jgi:hypothetical protein